MCIFYCFLTFLYVCVHVLLCFYAWNKDDNDDDGWIVEPFQSEIWGSVAAQFALKSTVL